MSDYFDVVIRNGMIVDGSGNPWIKVDLGISGGKISKIKREITASTSRTIDAQDLTISPGFIDVHSHSDWSLLVNPRAESKIREGVTTELVGNCGWSAAPITAQEVVEYKRFLVESEGNLGWFKVLAKEADWNWRAVSDYLRKLESQRIAVNVGTLVGQVPIRISVMGIEAREPTAIELEEMQSLVDTAMRDGAFGFSVALDYMPWRLTKKHELISLCRVVAKHGGLYVPHQMDQSEKITEATRDSIEVAEASGARLILPHMVPRIGGWGKGPQIIHLMEEARARGVQVAFDDWYDFVGSTPSLLVLIPPWALEGGMDKLVERLNDPETRERIKKDYMEIASRAISDRLDFIITNNRWDLVRIITIGKSKSLRGKSIAEIAKLRKTDPWDTALDLVRDEKGAVTVSNSYRSEADGDLFAAHPFSMMESDTLSIAPYGPLGMIRDWRAYNAYPHFLRTYVREKKLLSLPEVIRKMTSLPASMMGLRDRGLIREGMWADIVVFNANTVKERGSYVDPAKYPEGIEHVLVNGEIVVTEGEHTGALPGKVLRAQESIHWNET